MKKTIKYFLLFLITIMILQLNGQNPETFKIIVNKSNSVKSISSNDLKKVFLKKETRWADDTKIYPVDLTESSKTRENFTKEIHEKKVSAIKAYWQKQIFTGRGVPPPEKLSEKEVLEYVEKNEGAIGYISTRKSISKFDVKEVKVTDE